MKPLEQVLANPLYFQGLRGLTTLPSNVWVVANDPASFTSPDFNTINEAITAAVDNDTIIVFPGIYKESIMINKPLTIYGNCAFVHPYVPGRQSGESMITHHNPVVISSNNVIFNGFEITDFETGILIPSTAFSEPEYRMSHINLSFNWIHSTAAWKGISTEAGNLEYLTISDSIIDVDKSSTAAPIYALAGISLDGGGTSITNYNELTIRNNVLRNSSGYFNIHADIDPLKYTITKCLIESNHFLTRAHSDLEPGASFNLGNIKDGRFESNVVENTSGSIGISTGLISGNSFINGGALRLLGTETGYTLPSKEVKIVNNEFSNEINGTALYIMKGARAETITCNYNSFADSSISPDPLLDPTRGFIIRNDGLGNLDSVKNWWSYNSGPENNTGKTNGAITVKPWITHFSEDCTAKLCWPLFTFRDNTPGFYPRIINGITYSGATCFEPKENAELCALVDFTGGLGKGIPVTFWLGGRKYFTRTKEGGVATVKIGCLNRGCYDVVACAGRYEAAKTIHVMCHCPNID